MGFGTFGLPSLDEAMAKLDATSAQMEVMVARLDTVIGLLIRQNELLTDIRNNTNAN